MNCPSASWKKLFGPSPSPSLLSSIPLKGLALWRISAGLLLLWDAVQRLQEFPSLYLSPELMPPGDFWPLFLNPSSASAPNIILLFQSFAIVVYASWTLGWQTRLSHGLTLLCFFASLDLNYFTANAGDAALFLLLFWTFFLPVGQELSMDARGKSSALSPPRKQGFAATAVFWQIFLIYACSGLAKTGPSWREGIALEQIWQSDLALPGGLWLSQHLAPPTLSALSMGLPLFEMLVPILIFVPFFRPWPRRAAVLLLSLFNLITLYTMDLGLFPWILLSANLLLVEESDWNRLFRTSTVTPQSSFRRLPLFLIQNGLIAVAMILAALWAYNQTLAFPLNLSRVPLPRELERNLVRFKFHQNWRMFSPNPPSEQTTLLVEVKDGSGRSYDFFSGRAIGGEPSLPPGKAWRKYLDNISQPKRLETYLPKLSRYVFRQESAKGLNPSSVQIFRYRKSLTGPTRGQEQSELLFEEHHPSG